MAAILSWPQCVNHIMKYHRLEILFPILWILICLQKVEAAQYDSYFLWTFPQLFMSCNWYIICLQSIVDLLQYNDVIMSAMASQITSLAIIYSTVYSGADQRKHQSSASLAFVRGIYRWPVNSPHKEPVMRKMFPFDDVILGHRAYPMPMVHALWHLCFTCPLLLPILLKITSFVPIKQP